MPAQTTFDQKTLPWKTERCTLLKSLNSHKLCQCWAYSWAFEIITCTNKIASGGRIKAAPQLEEAATDPGSLVLANLRTWELAGARKDRAPASHLGWGCPHLLGLQEPSLKTQGTTRVRKNHSCLSQRQYRIIESTLEMQKTVLSQNKTLLSQFSVGYG